MKISVRAYAKINLMLDILSRLNNGYHDLFMIMQSVGLYDTVTVAETDSGEIEIVCNVNEIPTDEKNVAYKAAVEFFYYTEIDNKGLIIDIDKKIPHAAGLAGGSADAAGVIIALNELYKADLKEKDIIAIGSKIGADVPFCALGGTMLAQYTGTVLSHLPDLSKRYILIVKPDQNVSTGKAYAAFDTAERVRHLDTKGMLLACINDDWKTISEKVGNVFEQFIEVTDRTVIKGIMRKHSCLCCCMSGSGPSIFGVFEEKEKAEACLDELKKNFENSHLCTTEKSGCEIV